MHRYMDYVFQSSGHYRPLKHVIGLAGYYRPLKHVIGFAGHYRPLKHVIGFCALLVCVCVCRALQTSLVPGCDSTAPDFTPPL